MASIKCKGSILLKSHCGKCVRCFKQAVKIINGFKSWPISMLIPIDRDQLNNSMDIIRLNFGTESLRTLLLTGFINAKT